MSDLEKARQWAERKTGSLDMFDGETQAAVKLIKELPDQLVDAEKLREVLESYLSDYLRGTVGYDVAEEITRKLKAITTPKLPTLADMTPEEREACRWMQATVIDGEKAARGIIQDVYADVVWVMFQSGFRNNYRLEDVTPLPDLPRLKWPGSEVERPRLPEGMRLADSKAYGLVVVSPKVDEDGDYKVFYLDKECREGATYEYAHPDDLTFLDGEA